ncbi:3-dehydroquinate synthase [Planomicrobium sp. YIM 101495]|uniref:3-dehydroquinate synthase n=1 Tax=Planomicrobium sp. YIM 101495 TaxID=2665160 RepID=UPI0013F90F0B|nr:3-dehydroquinate synthase [Planomicrobium sp. YIM 101495]
MKTLEVQASEPYNVHIGAGVFGLFSQVYGELLGQADKIAVIVDEKVAALHLDKLMKELDGLPVLTKVIPSGEQAKSVDVFMDCQTFLLTEGFSRKSVLIAFGGGATGDVVGFVASTFMRGIPYIQVPTTILAHDSAVGGKTAINHPQGKNMVGTFYQPAAVVYETSLLTSLPPEQVRSGMAEVIKHAFISNEGWLEELLTAGSFSDMTEEVLADHLEKGILVKAAIVSEDEREGSVRKFLNFGHTLAHALEGYWGYGNITHGEAVVLGMAYALVLSRHDKLAAYLTWAEQNDYPLGRLRETDFTELLPYMKKDKKSSDGQLNFVMLEQTGQPFMQTIDEQVATAAYGELKSLIKGMIA